MCQARAALFFSLSCILRCVYACLFFSSNSLKTAFNWIFYAFSGYLESEQVSDDFHLNENNMAAIFQSW